MCRAEYQGRWIGAGSRSRKQKAEVEACGRRAAQEGLAGDVRVKSHIHAREQMQMQMGMHALTNERASKRTNQPTK